MSLKSTHFLHPPSRPAGTAVATTEKDGTDRPTAFTPVPPSAGVAMICSPYYASLAKVPRLDPCSPPSAGGVWQENRAEALRLKGEVAPQQTGFP